MRSMMSNATARIGIIVASSIVPVLIPPASSSSLSLSPFSLFVFRGVCDVEAVAVDDIVGFPFGAR
jgi:hypothetical protein